MAIPNEPLTFAALAAFLSIGLSFLLETFPWLRDAFDKIKTEYKPLVVLLLLMLLMAALMFAACQGVFLQYAVECKPLDSAANIIEAVIYWLSFVIGAYAAGQWSFPMADRMGKRIARKTEGLPPPRG